MTTKSDKAHDMIKVGGRLVQRIIRYPGPVLDGTPRCIQCGQIDDEPWHDAGVCADARRALVEQFNKTDVEQNEQGSGK
jgi:hypothetical protein